MARVSPLLLAALLLCACGGDDADTGADSSAQTSEQDTDTGDPSESETGDSDPVCFNNGGIYGKCSEGNMCQCVLGGDVYQSCTTSCTQASDCGDPADFPGATPICAPVNPGETDMICTLGCATTADCPCDLECEPTYLICSEPRG